MLGCVLLPLLCAAALGSCRRSDTAPAAGGVLGALADARLPRPFAARLSVPTRYRACTVAPPASGATVPAEACGPAEAPSAGVLAAAE
ncbi:MAG TPA: hypothetical protein VM890_12880, partial [Longimicrobium sp.]|nr:hypothetical protein [Longimicrobium sp.]